MFMRSEKSRAPVSPAHVFVVRKTEQSGVEHKDMGVMAAWVRHGAPWTAAWCLTLWIATGAVASAWRLPELFRHAPHTPQGQAYLRAAWRVFRKSPAVRQGPARAPVMVQILFDPDCPFCHALWIRMQPYRHSLLGIRWVPLALVRPSTLGKAAAIVTAPHPLEALAFDERHFNIARRSGGILPLYRVPPALRHAIYRNTRRLTRLDSLVPTLLYRDGRHIGILAGVPKASRLAALMRRLSVLSAARMRQGRAG